MSKIMRHMEEVTVWTTHEIHEAPVVEDWELSTINSVVWETDQERQERENLAILEEEWDATPWPSKRIAYPSVKFMVDHHAYRPSRPAELEKKYIDEMEKFKTQRDTLWKKQRDLKKNVDTAQKALQEEEAKPKTYGQKWSDKISGNTSDAIKHLKITLEKATNDYTKAKEEFDSFELTHRTIIALVEAHQDSMRSFELYLQSEKNLMEAMWGH